jgi:vacuolar-type H+-ATPase subunit C/Vma6
MDLNDNYHILLSIRDDRINIFKKLYYYIFEIANVKNLAIRSIMQMKHTLDQTCK